MPFIPPVSHTFLPLSTSLADVHAVISELVDSNVKPEAVFQL